jgi:hypothetical protein
MIDDALRLLWVVAAPAGLGVLCLRALGVRAAQDRLGYAAWLWPLGCLCLAAALWLLLALDVPPSLWWLAPPLAAAPLLPAAWRGAPHPRPLPVPLPWSRRWCCSASGSPCTWRSPRPARRACSATRATSGR